MPPPALSRPSSSARPQGSRSGELPCRVDGPAPPWGGSTSRRQGEKKRRWGIHRQSADGQRVPAGPFADKPRRLASVAMDAGCLIFTRYSWLQKKMGDLSPEQLSQRKDEMNEVGHVLYRTQKPQCSHFIQYDSFGSGRPRVGAFVVLAQSAWYPIHSDLTERCSTGKRERALMWPTRALTTSAALQFRDPTARRFRLWWALWSTSMLTKRGYSFLSSDSSGWRSWWRGGSTGAAAASVAVHGPTCGAVRAR